MRTLTFVVTVRIGDGPTPPGAGSRRAHVTAEEVRGAILEGAELLIDKDAGESAVVTLQET